MQNKLSIALGLIALLFLYLLFWPVPIDPVSWDAPVDAGLVDPFASNDRLRSAKVFDLGNHEGPEDVTGGPEPRKGRTQPTIVEMIFGSRQILLGSLIAERLKDGAPQVCIRPNLGSVRVLDFRHAKKILKETMPLKDEAKRLIEASIP